MSKRANDPEDVPLSFVPCRAFRHEPRFVTDRVTRGAGGQIIEFVRMTKCDVCGTQINTTYSVPDFRVVKRRYDYPDSYQVKGGFKVHDARMKYLDKRFES